MTNTDLQLELGFLLQQQNDCEAFLTPAQPAHLQSEPSDYNVSLSCYEQRSHFPSTRLRFSVTMTCHSVGCGVLDRAFSYDLLIGYGQNMHSLFSPIQLYRAELRACIVKLFYIIKLFAINNHCINQRE